MINVEKMLGGLLFNGLSGSFGSRAPGQFKRLIRGNKALIGVGFLGVAMGAYDHFTQDQTQKSEPPASLPSVQPPPPPTPSAARDVPPPPPGVSLTHQANNTLLIRAMIAAANADNQIDETERSKIMERFSQSGLTADERYFLLNELNHPQPIDDLLKQDISFELAEQIYLASLITIQVDTKEESQYLTSLAQKLNLDSNQVEQWHQELN